MKVVVAIIATLVAWIIGMLVNSPQYTNFPYIEVVLPLCVMGGFILYQRNKDEPKDDSK